MSLLACGDTLSDGMIYFCDSCSRCDAFGHGCEAPTDSYGTDPVDPHAAEVIGELAALRVEVAGLKALLNATLDTRVQEMDSRIRTIEYKLNLI